MFHIKLKAVFDLREKEGMFYQAKNSLNRESGQIVLIIWRKNPP